MTTMTMAEALIEAQKEIHFAKVDSDNPHFKSQFASFQSVHRAVVPVLNKHGFSLIFTTTMDNGTFLLIAHLAYKDGNKIVSSFPLPSQFDRPQVMGSAISYGKRYLTMGIGAIHSTADDDDGTAAEKGADEARETMLRAQAQKAFDELAQDLTNCLSVDELEKSKRTAFFKSQFQTLQNLDADLAAKLIKLGKERRAELEGNGG